MSTVAETYLEYSQTSQGEIFAKIVSGYKPLAIFAKTSIPDV